MRSEISERRNHRRARETTNEDSHLQTASVCEQRDCERRIKLKSALHGDKTWHGDNISSCQTTCFCPSSICVAILIYSDSIVMMVTFSLPNHTLLQTILHIILSLSHKIPTHCVYSIQLTFYFFMSCLFHLIRCLCCLLSAYFYYLNLVI